MGTLPKRLSDDELEDYKKEMMDFNTKAITKARVAEAAQAAGWSSPPRNITNIEATTAEVATAVSPLVVECARHSRRKFSPT